mgnify:CR=1 FL=1
MANVNAPFGLRPECYASGAPYNGSVNLYFGAADPKGGAVENGVRFFSQPTCHHRPDVYGGINESESAALLKEFFQARR